MALNPRSVNRLVTGLLLIFALIALTAAYWTVIAANDLTARSDNPRQIEAQQMQPRGALYDHNGLLLANSMVSGKTASGQPFMRRVYPQPDATSATGYFSVVHGVSGAEQAFDTLLRGEPVAGAEQAADNLLHRPAPGQDVRLTIDLKAQQAAAAAMRTVNAARGAVVAVDVPSGAIRVLLSAPGYDPNRFDDPNAFSTLLKDPNAPLLNRAVQGIYQPGGALETIILSALLTANVPLDKPLSGISQPLILPNLTIACGLSSGSDATWQGAFVTACPSPFAQAAADYSPDITRAIGAFGLTSVPTIAYSASPASTVTPDGSSATAVPVGSLGPAEGAGQGRLTVSPLQMAMVAAIIANHGNRVPLYMANATRAAGANDWQPLDISTDQAGAIAQNVANTVRGAMRQAVLNGTAQAADFKPNSAATTNPAQTPTSSPLIYGHASLAYSGDPKTALAWFIGFIDLPNGHSVAVAVVLEATPDLNKAAAVGGAVLQSFASNP